MIINLTPHEICVQSNGLIKKYPASGKVARLIMHQEQVDRIDGLPIMKTSIGKVLDYPGQDENYYIVSNIVGISLAMMNINNYLIPNTNEAIRDRDGKIIAVKNFHKYN